MDKKEKIRFIDEKRLEHIILEDQKTSKDYGMVNKTASNPVKGAFLKFVHIKNQFNINDL